MSPSRKPLWLRLPVVTAAPVATAPAAATAMPAPVAAAAPAPSSMAPSSTAPSPVAPSPVAPTHLFGRQAIDLVAGGERRLRIAVSRRQVLGERLRRERCGLSLGARGQRRRARGKSKGEFQKVAAFHDISLVAAI
jgi:hypothetical protein